MVCFFACGIWCLADISSAGPSPEQKGSDEGLTLETPAEHHIPQAKKKANFEVFPLSEI